MTESPQPVPEKSEVEKLRDEFTDQFQTMRTAFESQLAELKAANAELEKHNKELNRALIRESSSPPTPQPTPEPTPEEKYAALVDQRVNRAKELAKYM